MSNNATAAVRPPTPDQRGSAPDSPFDAIRRARPDGSEFWRAREMQPLMGYSRWDKLRIPLGRAMATARNQGLDVAHEFSQVSQVTRSGNLGDQAREDYELSRTAAHLLAMNGDPNKPEVAAAQMYFAVKTREAELAQQREATARPTSGAQVVLEMAQQLVAQETRISAIEETTAVTAAKVAAIEGRHDWFTALGYALLHNHPTGRPHLSQVGRRATALMREQGQEPGERQDATFGKVNVYPVSVLERAFAEVSR